jgi:hypothetical protein
MPAVIGLNTFVPVDPSMSSDYYFGFSGVKADKVCDNTTLSCSGIDTESVIISFDGKKINQQGFINEDGVNKTIKDYLSGKSHGDNITIDFYTPSDSTLRRSVQPLLAVGNIEKLNFENTISSFSEIGGLLIVEENMLDDEQQNVISVVRITDVDGKKIGMHVNVNRVKNNVIKTVNGTQVTTIEELKNILQKISNGKIIFNVGNFGYEFSLNIPKE